MSTGRSVNTLQRGGNLVGIGIVATPIAVVLVRAGRIGTRNRRGERDAARADIIDFQSAAPTITQAMTLSTSSVCVLTDRMLFAPASHNRANLSRGPWKKIIGKSKQQSKVNPSIADI